MKINERDPFFRYFNSFKYAITILKTPVISIENGGILSDHLAIETNMHHFSKMNKKSHLLWK